MLFAGPVVAEAMFLNREEIPVYPIYRDPVSMLFKFAFFVRFSDQGFRIKTVALIVKSEILACKML